MSEKEQILIVQSDGGDIIDVLGSSSLEVMYLDLRETDQGYENEWYCRDTLVQAERWPKEWRDKYASQIENCISKVEEAGLEPPAWVMEQRNSKLMGLLSDIESL